MELGLGHCSDPLPIFKLDCFPSVNFKSYLHILDTYLLSDMCCANIFSQSMTWTCILLNTEMFFSEQKFLILIKPISI